MALTLRLAEPSDIPVLTTLMQTSIRSLHTQDYTSRQIEAALSTVYGIDSQLVADGTYFVVQEGETVVACGGWSRRRTLYGGDVYSGRDDSPLDPACDAAKIRAFFVHPRWVRRGIGSLLLEACEQAAMKAGFWRFEMGATLPGVPLYAARGYAVRERLEVPLPDGDSLAVVAMEKRIER